MTHIFEYLYIVYIICEVLEHVPYTKIDSILKSLRRIKQKEVIISVLNQKTIYKLSLFKLMNPAIKHENLLEDEIF